MKAIYETRLEVEQSITAEYLVWLREHMKQIVEQTGFERADMFTLEHDSAVVQIWVVHYVAPSRSVIDEYLELHAPRFRGDGVSRFGSKVKIERRILNFQETFPS